MAKRPTSERIAHVGICLYPGVWGSSASLARDVLHIASVIARARPGSGGIEVRFLGARSGDVPTASGMAIRAEERWDRTDVDVIILPSRAVHFLVPEGHPPGLADWITRQHARGCSVLAMTTGSWLLAETGLLQGHTATTHWACLDRCRRQYPGVDWTSDLRLAVTGRIVTARDMSASAVALCHVVGRALTVPIAERTYQYSLIYEPGSEALPLLHTIPLRDHGDAQVLEVQEWLEARYGQPISAKEAARLVHMSPRNLRRRFLEATGRTLSAYLTDIRLARARALLLSSNEAVSQIAHRVGYEDPSTFTALFKQHHGQTPSAYRKSSAGTAD
ncbi:GlxA family transcriptional regulator [Vitiosangium sp. GDMCC 1.1324]|uniref:GlxA family transcriptional regulator n=1 Tax=Vitiosangium sp. (strain GDMCC 1.1324) TaxID=2138576 RepID=UPI000D3AF53C|nr:helix-turn-helix domain-containing protein [Vitiosangium sp. GDMCC 1.1324]PTL78962.1 AraC family transcriptional regulator [Vitiosangium sp. GDMCC 1.1324]